MPALAQSERACIAAIVSGNAAGARKLANFYGVKEVVGYADFDALVQSSRIDAAYIAVPNPMHAAFAIRSARAGKHVIVEKPIATTIADAEEMIRAARESGVMLMTSYRLHHEAGTVAALDAIRDGRIGDPRYFSAIFSFQAQSGNHRLSSSHWAGPLQDIGIYCINASRHIFASEPIEAGAVASRLAEDPRFQEIEDALAVTLRFPRDRLAQFYCSFGASDLDMYRVVGSKGHLTMEPGFRFETPTRMCVCTAAGAETFSFPHCDHFGGLIAYFCDCIANGTPPEPDGEEGLADLRVLLAIEKSVKSGHGQTIASSTRPGHPSADTVRTVLPAKRRLVL